MVDKLKDFLAHEEKEFVESGEDQDEKEHHGLISDDSDEENEMARNQKSRVDCKVEQRCGDEDHGSAHSDYSEKNFEETERRECIWFEKVGEEQRKTDTRLYIQEFLWISRSSKGK